MLLHYYSSRTLFFNDGVLGQESLVVRQTFDLAVAQRRGEVRQGKARCEHVEARLRRPVHQEIDADGVLAARVSVPLVAVADVLGMTDEGVFEAAAEFKLPSL